MQVLFLKLRANLNERKLVQFKLTSQNLMTWHPNIPDIVLQFILHSFFLCIFFNNSFVLFYDFVKDKLGNRPTCTRTNVTTYIYPSCLQQLQVEIKQGMLRLNKSLFAIPYNNHYMLASDFSCRINILHTMFALLLFNTVPRPQITIWSAQTEKYILVNTFQTLFRPSF